MKLILTILLIGLCCVVIQSKFTASKFMYGRNNRVHRADDDAKADDAAKEGDDAAKEGDDAAKEGGDDAAKDGEAAKDGACPAGAGDGSADAAKIMQPDGGNLICEGWLKVSNMDYMDYGKNPAVPLENGDLKGINIAEPESEFAGEKPLQTYFRENEKFGKDPAIKAKTLFYFRLSGTNLYYTETQTDMRVLGAIAIKNVRSVGKSTLGLNCFQAENSEQDKWDLCANSKEEKKEWIKCHLKALGIEEEPEKKPETPKEEVLVQQPILMISLPSPYCNEGWNYVTHGEEWNCKCKEGNQQSPVKVPNYGDVLNKSAIFTFQKVDLSALKIVYEDAIVKVRCNSQDCSSFSFGSIIDVDYTEYAAREVHFHVPAEHSFNGKQYPMEIQIIADPTTQGDFRKKAVIAFMVEQIPGGSNQFLDKFDFLDLPNVINYRVKFPVPTDDKKSKQISLEDFWRVEEDDSFHGYFSYINYNGSLTAPPCQEDVKWFIVEEPLKLGMAAIEMFKDSIQNVPTVTPSQSGPQIMASDMTSHAPEGNNRNLQELNDRRFEKFDLWTNPCYPKPEQKVNANDGHYERVEKKAITYIYIPNQIPTGLPNALVVTKEEATGKDGTESAKPATSR